MLEKLQNGKKIPTYRTELAFMKFNKCCQINAKRTKKDEQ